MSFGSGKSEESSALLYERWIEVARERSSELALAELPSGSRWTFDDLRRAGEREEGNGAPLAFPQGNDAGFFVTLLRAWRRGAVACPLEPGQTAPSVPVPSGCSHLKLTSGSTGSAKCVIFTASQLAADPRNIVQTMGLRREWPNLGAISLAHSYGFSNLVLPLLLHGIPMILVPAPLPELVRRAGREFRDLTLPAVPALWKTWMAADSIPNGVRLAISAGAPLPLELEHELFRRNGLKVHNFYGSTECGAIAYDRASEPRSDAALAGTAAEGVRLEIGAAGTLEVRSEAVGSGYWPEPRAELSGGRFVTSDQADIGSSGVYLRGRLSEVINVAGRKVAPETIEQALRQHPDVRECVVFGVSSGSERLETIVAIVNASEATPSWRLGEFLSRRLDAWKLPRDWWFTPELRPDLRGKISRAEWKRRYLERTPGSKMPAGF